MSDLRKRVAEAMWMADPDPYDTADRRPFSEADWEARRNYLAEADAAIALVLEEAAKVAEENAASLDYPSVYMEGPSRRAKMKVAGIAAAIRALKEKSDD